MLRQDEMCSEFLRENACAETQGGSGQGVRSWGKSALEWRRREEVWVEVSGKAWSLRMVQQSRGVTGAKPEPDEPYVCQAGSGLASPHAVLARVARERCGRGTNAAVDSRAQQWTPQSWMPPLLWEACWTQPRG